MIKLKLNVDMLDHKAGQVIHLPTDKQGNILANFWARRLKDSKIDNCVEILPEEKKQNKSKDRA